jgi:hypothetical protein
VREPASLILACCATLLVLAGCAADPPTDDDTTEYPCAGYESLATADELASTPRADHDLELLAIRMSQQFVASQEDYDRVVADVTAIRDMDERVSHITPRLWYDGRTLSIWAEDAVTFEAMQDGSYVPWQCLHEAYEFQSIESDYGCCNVMVTLEGIYDNRQLEDEYRAMAGVVSAMSWNTNYYEETDGPTIRGAIEGETCHYIFRDAWDDCPAGCLQGTEYYYRTEEPGEATLVDTFTWTWEEGAPSYPDWHYDYSFD